MSRSQCVPALPTILAYYFVLGQMVLSGFDRFGDAVEFFRDLVCELLEAQRGVLEPLRLVEQLDFDFSFRWCLWLWRSEVHGVLRAAADGLCCLVRDFLLCFFRAASAVSVAYHGALFALAFQCGVAVWAEVDVFSHLLASLVSSSCSLVVQSRQSL